MSLSRGIGLLGESLITHHLSKTRSQTSFLSIEVIGSSSLVRTWMKPPSFFIVGEFLCLVRLSRLFDCFSLSLCVAMIDGLLLLLFCSFPASSFEEEVPASC